MIAFWVNPQPVAPSANEISSQTPMIVSTSASSPPISLGVLMRKRPARSMASTTDLLIVQVFSIASASDSISPRRARAACIKAGSGIGLSPSLSQAPRNTIRHPALSVSFVFRQQVDRECASIEFGQIKGRHRGLRGQEIVCKVLQGVTVR